MRRRHLAVVVALALVAAASAQAVTISSAAGEIDGTSLWINPGPTVLTYIVTQNLNGSWHYDYTLSVVSADISHFIIQTSGNFTMQDVISSNEPLSLGTYTTANGNPNIPAPIYGVKWDGVNTKNASLVFDSWRAPMWGSFYAKCGNPGGSVNTAWNTGLDPNVVNGTFILVPDTVGGPVPEPGSLVALMAGVVGLAGRFRRRS